MKCTGINADRDAHPLMKELHELGLKHGMAFVVLAIPMDGKSPLQSFLIDHRDDTGAEDVSFAFEAAGVHFIKAAEAVGDFRRDAEPKP